MIRGEKLKTLAALTLFAAGCGSSTCKAGSCAPPDAGADRCSTAAMLISCTNASGGGSATLSNSEDACSASGDDCVNKCTETEYAASCGGIPQQLPDGGSFEPSSDPPAENCRNVGVTPAGNAFYCCPCS